MQFALAHPEVLKGEREVNIDVFLLQKTEGERGKSEVKLKKGHIGSFFRSATVSINASSIFSNKVEETANQGNVLSNLSQTYQPYTSAHVWSEPLSISLQPFKSSTNQTWYSWPVDTDKGVAKLSKRSSWELAVAHGNL